MRKEKRERRKRVDAEQLSKQIQGLISLNNSINDIAKLLGMQRQLVEYYARYRKLSTPLDKSIANKTE